MNDIYGDDLATATEILERFSKYCGFYELQTYQTIEITICEILHLFLEFRLHCKTLDIMGPIKSVKIAA